MLIALFSILTAHAAIHLDQIKLPPGFEISVFNDRVEGARSMALSPTGVLYVGTRKQGKVYAIKDGKVHVIAEGLNMPNGVALREGSLYVAEINRVTRYDDIDSQLDHPPKPVLLNDHFPSDKHHGWKFIRFSPDGWLYVPVGAPCNDCLKDDPRYASIMRMRPDGSHLEVYASGVRNTVGFDFSPKDHSLWFTDNGRDMMGDEIPPDKLNHAPHKGMNFGFPYCQGGDIPDPEFGKLKPCSDFTPPEVKFPAHVATLGMRFYTGHSFPKEYQGQIFVAEHGSWNRSKKIGYRIERVPFDKTGHALGHEVFASGWLQGEENWGRPVDVLVTPEGDLLVSDDFAGAIYRITYKKQP